MERPFRAIGSADQWWRAHHEHTALDRASGVVSLAWTTSTSDAIAGPAPRHAGLAFDRRCHLYRVRAAEVVRVRWATPRPAGAPPRPEEPVLTPPADPPPSGGFRPMEPANAPAALRGVAVDQDDRLFVGAGRAIHIFDLWSRRHLRTVRFPVAVADLVSVGRHVRVLFADGAIARLAARTAPRPLHAPFTADARALAVDPAGQSFVLTAGQIVPLIEPAALGDPIAVAGATDLLFDTAGALVVARQPGQDFLRMRLADGVVEHLPPLKARGYDGAGIALTPDGRVVYFTATGLRHARAARLRYEATGRIVGFRLDSGGYRTQWGRVFLDACIPPGTSVRVRCVARDEMPDGATLPGDRPVNLTEDAPSIADPPPQLPERLDDPAAPTLPLVRRATRELPWARFAADDPFTTYEAHAITPPGRFLWVEIELRGDTRRTPQVRMLRVEAPGHDHLTRLPAVYSRDPAQRDFLQRYLALFDGILGELELRSLMRLALVDPHSTPAELLPWLASFLGLALDERWTEAARRQLIAEAAALYRHRGTLASLQRMLELALDHRATGGPSPVIIIEQYRFRGLGAVVGEAASTRAILGGGFRVGGAVGVEGSAPLSGTAADAFATHAHRFTVVLQAQLDGERRAMIEDLLEVHAPAHTVWTVCAADTGMRIGRGLHVGLSSLIGPTGGFAEAVVGGRQLGRGTVMGRPSPGLRVGAPLGGERVG